MSRTPTAYSRRKRDFPTSENELLLHIEDLCPEPVLKPGMTEAEIMFQAGRRSVWRDVRAAYEASFARPGDN